MKMSVSVFEWTVNDNRKQFGVQDTVRALVCVYGYTASAARALVKRLRDEDLGPLADPICTEQEEVTR